MAKCLDLHFEQQMVLQMAPLMDLIDVNPRVTCSEIDFDKNLVLHLIPMMVLWMDTMMA